MTIILFLEYVISKSKDRTLGHLSRYIRRSRKEIRDGNYWCLMLELSLLFAYLVILGILASNLIDLITSGHLGEGLANCSISMFLLGLTLLIRPSEPYHFKHVNDLKGINVSTDDSLIRVLISYIIILFLSLGSGLYASYDPSFSSIFSTISRWILLASIAYFWYVYLRIQWIDYNRFKLRVRDSL